MRGETANRRRVVLVADDKKQIRELLRDVLSDAGYAVLEAADGRQAVRICREATIDLVITDLVMPEQDGIETIQALRLNFPSVPLIAMSGMFDIETILRTARNLGAAAVFSKPLDVSEIVRTVAALLGDAS